MAGEDQSRDGWVHDVLGLDMAKGGAGPGGLAALEQPLHEAVSMAPEQRQGLMAAWEFASEQERGGDAQKAQAATARLKQEIDAVLAAGPSAGSAGMGIEPGLVAARRKELEAFFLQRIGAAKQQVKTEVGKLSAPLDELIEQPEALVQAIGTQMDALLDELWSGLNAALGAEDGSGAGKAIAVWKDHIAAEPRVVKLQAAAGLIGADLNIDAAIAALAQDAAKQLNAATP